MGETNIEENRPEIQVVRRGGRERQRLSLGFVMCLCAAVVFVAGARRLVVVSKALGPRPAAQSKDRMTQHDIPMSGIPDGLEGRVRGSSGQYDIPYQGID